MVGHMTTLTEPAHAGEEPAEKHESDEHWRRFTPTHIYRELCLARTWNGGQGGQCTKTPASGSEFCKTHQTGEKWRTHGRLDGPIPGPKLKEFMRTNSGVIKAGKPKARAKESADTPVRKRPLTPQKHESTKDSVPAKKLDSKDSPRGESGKASTDSLPVKEVGDSARDDITGKAPPSDDTSQAPTSPTTNMENTSEPSRPAKSAPAQKAPPPKPKPVKAKPEKPRKCTCGCPIHTEKCKLFRVRFVSSAEFGPNRSTGPPPPTFERRGTAPASVSDPPAPMSEWARQQVNQIDTEIRNLPVALQKGAWKQKMKQFHPDKRQARPENEFAGKSDAQVAEVFMEIKRRYDRCGSQEHLLQQRHQDFIAARTGTWYQDRWRL